MTDGSRSSPFFGPDGRLRAIPRLALYLALTASVVIVLQVIAYGALMSLSEASMSPAPAFEQLTLRDIVPVQIANLIGITTVTIVARRWLDRRSFVSLGLQRQRGWTRELVIGLWLGFVLMALIFLVEWSAGLITWEVSIAFSPWSLVGALIIFAMVAWSEELLMRGYVLQNMAESWGAVPAAVASSLLFSLLHFGNPGADLMSGIGLLFAGLLFAVAFFATGRLWLPMGLHFAWNFAEGAIFGFPVSGLSLDGILSTSPAGPALVTGGSFGPEAGLSGIVATLLGTVVCYLYGRRRASDSPAQNTH